MANVERNIQAELLEEERRLLISAQRSRMGGIALMVIGVGSFLGMIDSIQSQRQDTTTPSVASQEQDSGPSPQGFLTVGIFSGGGGAALLERAGRKRNQASWMYESRTGKERN